MRISSAFPSKYLKAADLDGRQVTVTISHVDMEDVATGEEPKPVLYFDGKEKGVVLNKTNANVLSMAYGDDTDDWTGQKITLFEAMVSYQGNTVAAIRMKLPPRDKPAKPSSTFQSGRQPVPMTGPQPTAPLPGPDDDIPF